MVERLNETIKAIEAVKPAFTTFVLPDGESVTKLFTSSYDGLGFEFATKLPLYSESPLREQF